MARRRDVHRAELTAAITVLAVALSGVLGALIGSGGAP